MDADRFEDLLRALSAMSSRRGVVQALAGLGLVGPLGLLLENDDAHAGKKRRRRRRRRRKHKKPSQSFCAEKNSCDVEAQCQSSGGGDFCFCFVTALNGTPFCGLAGVPVDNCAECGGATCINVSGPLCGGGPAVACSLPCPNPQ
jgi:hypothetical protein